MNVKTIFFLVCVDILTFVTYAPEVTNCPQRSSPELLETGRACRKLCIRDEDCIGQLESCHCDGDCGMSCFNQEEECPHLPLLNNGNIEYPHGSVYGGQALHSCNAGFQLIGNAIRYCRSDKKWNGTEPACRECHQHLERVIGGCTASRDAWPSQALITTKFSLTKSLTVILSHVLGGGSLIGNKWILTAAHVLDQQYKNYLLITLGLNSRIVPEATARHFQPKRIFIHPDYRSHIKNGDVGDKFDIALIELGQRFEQTHVGGVLMLRRADSSELTFSRYINIANLPCSNKCVKENIGEGCQNQFNWIDNLHRNNQTARVTLVGFGYTSWQKHDSRLANVLQQVDLQIQQTNRCVDAINKVNGLVGKTEQLVYSDYLLCAGHNSKSSVFNACYGDSGGPLMKQVWNNASMEHCYIQIGIVSFGWLCGDRQADGYTLPDFYTNVYKYLSWIKEHMVNLKCDFEDYDQPFCDYTASWGWRREQQNGKSGSYVAKAIASRQTLTSLVADIVPGMCVKFWYRTNGFVQLKEIFKNALLYKNHNKENENVWQNTSIPLSYGYIEVQLKFESVGGSLEVDNIVVETNGCVNNCADDPCMNGGTCVNRINAYTCFCTMDFGGPNCENDLKCPDTTSSIPNGIRTEIYTNHSYHLEGSTVTYRCNVNYKFKKYPSYIDQVITSTCNRTREWDPPLTSLQCEKMLCRGISPQCGISETKELTASIGRTLEFQRMINPLKEIRGNANVTCLSHGKWSGMLPECVYKQLSHTYVAGGIEYIAYLNQTLNKKNAENSCKNVVAGSLLIAYGNKPRNNVNAFLEHINIPRSEYWLAMTHLHEKRIGRNKVRHEWKWYDGRVTFKRSETAWRRDIDKPRKGYCPIIGRELCWWSGTYCWKLVPCNHHKPLVCQRAFNPCYYSPCRNRRNCTVHNETALGYICSCGPLYSGENCTEENFCALNESLSSRITIDNNLLGAEVERGVLIWRTGFIAKFKCVNKNEKILNNAVLQCIGNGVWNGSFPTICVEQVTCTRPPPPNNGYFLPVHENKMTFEIGDEMKFSCYDGYTVDLFNRITCSKGRVWEPTDYNRCEGQTCNTPYLPVDVFVKRISSTDNLLYYNYHHNHQYTFYCVDNQAYTTVLMCTLGRWSRDYRVFNCHTGAGFSDQVEHPATFLTTLFPKICAVELSVHIMAYAGTRWFISSSTSPEQSLPEGNTLLFECKSDLKEIRGNTNVTCLSHGKWSGIFPECVYKQLSHTYVADGIEYIAYLNQTLTKTNAESSCNVMGEGSLLIAYGNKPRNNVNAFLEQINIAQNEYWLAMTHVREKSIFLVNRIVGGKRISFFEVRNEWKWYDGHVTLRSNETAWRNYIDKPRQGYCPVIGRELCWASGTYCWKLVPCNHHKPLVCQRVFNPCYYSPCINRGKCTVHKGTSLGYICTCGPLYSGVNCSEENFCALNESLSSRITIDNLLGAEVERGVLIWRTGFIAKFKCVNENEKILNNAVLQCIGNGVWNGSFPTICTADMMSYR